MRTWMRWSGALAAGATLAVALVLSACVSQDKHAQMSDANRARGEREAARTGQEYWSQPMAVVTQPPPGTQPGISQGVPAPTNWAPAGYTGDSLGLAQNLIDYRNVPQIDLEQALRAAQGGAGGGGGGRSAFRGESERALLAQRPALWGDIPVIANSIRSGEGDADVAKRVAVIGPPAFRASEELWVITRYEVAGAPANTPDVYPGCGALVCCPPPAENQPPTTVPVPLKHTDVKADILGWIATVRVQQQFTNPFSSKIEAVYVFPLPENAAVNEFVMTIGERHIRGVIRERAEAQRIYTEARSQGYTASLLTQERPNIFTQNVANIEPGKEIDIDITYFHTLAYHDGGFDFTFPMVVGPRFNPSGSVSGVGAVPRNDTGASGQATEIAYLRPSERNGHDITLSVDIDAGVAIEKIQSRSHDIEINRDSDDTGRARVRLASKDTVPNKDFTLRYELAGEKVKSALLTQADPKGKGGYFALMIIPPAEMKQLRRSPMEIVFVVDRSGSMQGQPIAQARDAVEHGLRRLQPGDTFQIIDFAESASQLGAGPLDATPGNIQRGLKYAATLDASGGTMMINGLNASLGFAHDPERLRVVSFITDGLIGNEPEILKPLHDHLGATRVFGVGVGSAPNRHLLSEMSRIGRGAVAYLGLQDPAGEVMDLFFDRISHAAMTDLKMDWGGIKVTDLFPSRVPDLFVGRPVILTGRYEGDWNAAGSIKVRGRAGGEMQEFAISADTRGSRVATGSLPAVWARMKIADLGDRELLEGISDAQTDVKRVALEYGLMSAYTSFVAVDSLTRTEGNYGTTVPVAVPVPEGVRYDTTVGGTARAPDRR